MPGGNLVNVSQLFDKTIFAKTATNIRSLPSADLGTIIQVVKAGGKIGVVKSYVNGFKKSYSDKDGFVWLQLYPVTGVNQNKPTYTKLFPDMLDWKSLQDQGVQTVEEQKEAEEEKDKSNFDKAMDQIKKSAPWIIGGYFLLKYSENKKG